MDGFAAYIRRNENEFSGHIPHRNPGQVMYRKAAPDKRKSDGQTYCDREAQERRGKARILKLKNALENLRGKGEAK